MKRILSMFMVFVTVFAMSFSNAVLAVDPDDMRYITENKWGNPWANDFYTEDCADLSLADDAMCRKIPSGNKLLVYMPGFETETEVVIRVKYLDEGNGGLKLIYRTAANNFYFNLTPIDLTDSGDWKTHDFLLSSSEGIPVPKLDHSASSEDDLRIEAIDGDLFIGGVEALPVGALEDAAITPTEAGFDKHVLLQEDIDIALILNGHTLDAVKNDTDILNAGTDYTISESKVTLKKAYLATLPVGETTLTFDMDSGTDPQLTITVNETLSEAVTIKLSGDSNIVIPNEDDSVTKQYEAVVKDQFDQIMTGQLLEWHLSEDADGVTIDASGMVTVDSSAEAGKITVQVNLAADASINDELEVMLVSTEIPVTGVKTDQDDVTVEVGDSVQINAEVEPSTANQAVYWETSDLLIATVDPSGLITGLNPGMAEVTVTSVTYSVYQAVVTVNVVDTTAPTWPVDSALSASDITDNALTLTWPEASDLVGVTQYIVFQDSMALMTVAASQTSVTIDELDPATLYDFEVKAADASGNQSAGLTVTVETDTGISNIAVDHTDVTLETGESIEVVAAVMPESALQDVEWVIADASVAEIAQEGLTAVITGLSPGSTIATVSSTIDPSVSADVNITVVSEKKQPPVRLPEVDHDPQQFSRQELQVSRKSNADGWSQIVFTVHPQKMEQALSSFNDSQSEQEIVIDVTGETDVDNLIVRLPADVILQAAAQRSDAVIVIQTEHVSYRLPLQSLDFEALKAQLDPDDPLQHDTINITFGQLSEDEQQLVEQSASGLGADMLVQPMAISVSLTAGGATAALDPYLRAGAALTYLLPEDADWSQATAVWIDPETGKLRFQPFTIEHLDENRHFMHVMQDGTSVYAIVHFDKTFADIANHWAQQAIDMLASKLVLEDVESELFNPSLSVTNDTLTRLLIQAVGLKDPVEQQLFEEALQAVLIPGSGQQLGNEERVITREEMIAMIYEAVLLINGEAGTAANANIDLDFNDADAVSAWAMDAVSWAVQHGLVTGIDHETLSPNTPATRAQAALIMAKMLQFIGYIND